jgi:hypothetical protein
MTYHLIQTDGTEMMKQAGMTAETYLDDAIRAIDKLFRNEGSAYRHPDLIAAFMQTAAIDCAAQQIRAGLDGIAQTLNENLR